MKQVILGSKSPRRKEILQYFSIPFLCIAPSFDEEAVAYEGCPNEHAKRLSEGKNKAISSLHPESLIITADTVVAFEGKLFGKPKNLEEAKTFLKILTGNWHTVITAVTLNGTTELEQTRVLFHKFTDREIALYLQSIQWEDKAGAYAIQGAGGLLVCRIEGCYTNVMGLPINTLQKLCKQVGIDLLEWAIP